MSIRTHARLCTCTSISVGTWSLGLLLLIPKSSGAQVTNAPVAPDTIYVARFGPIPGVSVIDLNGFGQSTGNPTYDPLHPVVQGNSNFPNNPNVALQGALLGLMPGTSTLDGGSAGVFTLTKDSALGDLLVHPPLLGSVGDMMLGHALDSTFNNGPPPFGCQAGGGNICAGNGLKSVQVAQGGPNSLAPPSLGSAILNTVVAGENPISWAPHPNPPPLISFPLCSSPLIRGQEPTSVNVGFGLSNLLVPGDPFGNPGLGIPPSGLLVKEQNAFFLGPSPPQVSIGACFPYQMRQQVGHFLYLIDRQQHQVVVLNSNSFAVLDRIAQSDPTELAMGPNLDLLAVTNQAIDAVAFIDIDPGSATFHQVVKTTPVGHAPRGIAWDPGNEDVLVCNEGGNSVSVISAATLAVRKVVTHGLNRPFAVAITPRQDHFGLLRNVYFGYILDRAGVVSLFESGPAGPGGWGYDDVIGSTSFGFSQPRAIQPDPIRLKSGVWIAHQGQLDPLGQPTGLSGGAVSNLVLDTTVYGRVPVGSLRPPDMHQLTFRVAASLGSDQLTGLPLDIGFDDQLNFGALANYTTPFSAGSPVSLNGKNLVRELPAGQVVNTNQPNYLFLAVRPVGPGPGGVDVIELRSGKRVDTNVFLPGVQSIPASGAAVVMDYFRQ